MKQKQVQKKAKPSAKKAEPKKRITITPKPTVAEDFDTVDLKEWLKNYKPNHFKLALMDFELAFSNLWRGIKGLFKK